MDAARGGLRCSLADGLGVPPSVQLDVWYFARRAVNRAVNHVVDQARCLGACGPGRSAWSATCFGSAFLNVPMPRHLIRTSAHNDGVAFHVLDRDLASVYGVVGFKRDEAMEDQ